MRAEDNSQFAAAPLVPDGSLRITASENSSQPAVLLMESVEPNP